MVSNTLVNAADVTTWANRRDAQALLPKLLRHLIHVTVNTIEQINFPSDEAVQLGGWDGTLKVENGNAFVPDGVSGWEMGVTRDVKGKADDDYEKRRNNSLGLPPSETSFVFVTPRRWGGKDGWVTTRLAEGIWRDVKAYDADDIVQWLELAPGVHIWLSILLGKHPEGAIDIENYWRDWAETTSPPMSPELVISGRQEGTERIYNWLREPPSSLALKSESQEESLGFFAAALFQLMPDERDLFIPRTIVVRDRAAWHQLIASNDPLFLIPVFDEPDGITRAVKEGHHVLLPVGNDAIRSTNTLEISRVQRRDAKQALMALELSEERSADLATLARRSLMALRRKLAVNPEIQRPAWAKPAEARSILPAILAGAWDDTSNGDRDVVAKLTHASYDEMNALLVRWANESDPPVRRVGNTWLLVSKEDAWELLANFLTRDDLDNLENVVLDVLGQADPGFDLPSDERWKANILGKSLPYSPLLRESLAETIALMGARSELLESTEAASGQDRANRFIGKLLDKANEDWRIWASIADLLPLLAEAAPDMFLDRVERGLAGDNPILLNLFSEGEDTIFSSSPHTGLLWALETIAWSSEHIGRAALLLAKLTRLDPGGKLMNRPGGSLREIFLCWHPQTTASLEKRLRVLDAIRSREPGLAWNLLCALVPDLRHSTAMGTAKPRWREWATDKESGVTYAELFEAEREIVSRLLDDVGTDGRRWRNLIHKVGSVSREQRDRIVESLRGADVESFTPEDRMLIWESLRALISDHRKFSTADWALPQELIDRLEQTYEGFEPEDPISKVAWLFSNAPNLLNPPKREWLARETAIENARIEAVQDIEKIGGLPLLLEMEGRVEQKGILGFILGKSDLLAAQEDAFIEKALGSSKNPHNLLARNIVAGQFQLRGWDWVNKKLSEVSASSWSSEQIADFLTCLPFERQAWDLVETMGEDIQRLYWSSVVPIFVQAADCERVAVKLIEHDRPDFAIDLMALHSNNEQSATSPQLVAEALEKLLRTPEDKQIDWGAIGYDIAQLILVLSASEEIEESRVASLEWAYLTLLQQYGEPKTLHRELSRNPNFFGEVVSLVYRAEDEDRKEVAEDERTRAQYGYELLHSWRRCPGCREDGSIDGEALREWVVSARDVLRESGRTKIGDQAIGEVLSFAPIDPDGAWPPTAVRDLIEELASDDLELGIEVKTYNNRGVVTRSLTEGGAQERQLVETYNNYANQVADRWPRTAAMLRRLANTYASEARREDTRAELREDLGR